MSRCALERNQVCRTTLDHESRSPANLISPLGTFVVKISSRTAAQHGIGDASARFQKLAHQRSGPLGRFPQRRLSG